LNAVETASVLEMTPDPDAIHGTIIVNRFVMWFVRRDD
jgi:hypothetical protein